jgi:hypothetical protein
VVVDDREADGGWRVRVRLTSRRNAGSGGVFFPPSVTVRGARVAGRTVPVQSGSVLMRSNGWHRYSILTLPPEGIELEFEFASANPVSFYAADWSAGVPADAGGIIASLGESQPYEYGHLTMVTKKVVISPSRRGG